MIDGYFQEDAYTTVQYFSNLFRKLTSQFDDESIRWHRRRPERWRTLDGEEKMISQIDHQHLSNIIWYHAILANSYIHWALELIEEKFEGKILPYRPPFNGTMTNEIRALHVQKHCEVKYYSEDGEEVKAFSNISYDGQIVGYIKFEI